MLKLREDALFTASHALSSHFAGIKLGTHNQNDGVNFLRQVRLIGVSTNPAAAETIVVGANTYTFRVTPTLATEIAIGTLKADTALNIVNKINVDKATCGCTAYVVGNGEKLILVETVAGASPTFTNDGVKIEAETAWAYTFLEATLESESVYKVPLTDVNAKPIVLAEHHHDGDGVSGYSGAFPYQNFLY